ncbi:MAG: hypothetical protein Q8O42_12640 [Acidobacteriota bacterium]|nr:hypothetical protein [Acidobacteriota bacterium]
MRGLLSVVLCSVLSVSNLFAEPATKPRDGGPRIRPQDARSTQLLRAGMARSDTFRALVERLEASNVFVYVSVSPLIKSSLAGQLTWMTQAGPYRYLRATLNAGLGTDQQIATLGHELQHAVEVLDDELVVGEKSLVALYRRIGQPSRAANSGWETVAAQETGYRVRRELGESAGVLMAAQLFNFDHL